MNTDGSEAMRGGETAVGGEFDARQWRKRFPVFENKIYLNSCSYGAVATDVRAAYEAYLTDREREGSYWDHWVGQNEELRASIARLLGATPAEIAITASLSAGLNALVSSLDFSGKRNKVILSDLEFPTVGQIWHAQKRRGARVEIAAREGGRVPIENFEALIDDETLIVSITHVSYKNGARNDIPAIVALARRHGAMVMLDSYQAMGTFPISPQTLDVDFLAAGVLKYLLGSAGLAFLYVRQDMIGKLEPLATGWFAQKDIFAMDHTANEPADDARRFEAGTPPVPNVYAALAGLKIIHEVGLENIEAHVRGLTARVKQRALDEGFTLATPTDPAAHGAMIALKSTDMVELTQRLEREDIVTSYRDGNLRISPHFYNIEDDIDATMAALVRHRDLLA
ncbi:MAG: aminotransferase class V-fold PLP-dependent enzyme [Proteobacteria bacterium]|nr:aminotransferase class V-fold PLP-dependent enzyme [Pseudomonadota bacterium]